MWPLIPMMQGNGAAASIRKQPRVSRYAGMSEEDALKNGYYQSC